MGHVKIVDLVNIAGQMLVQPVLQNTQILQHIVPNNHSSFSFIDRLYFHTLLLKTVIEFLQIPNNRVHIVEVQITLIIVTSFLYKPEITFIVFYSFFQKQHFYSVRYPIVYFVHLLRIEHYLAHCFLLFLLLIVIVYLLINIIKPLNQLFLVQPFKRKNVQIQNTQELFHHQYPYILFQYFDLKPLKSINILILKNI